MLGSETGGCW